MPSTLWAYLVAIIGGGALVFAPMRSRTVRLRHGAHRRSGRPIKKTSSDEVAAAGCDKQASTASARGVQNSGGTPMETPRAVSCWNSERGALNATPNASLPPAPRLFSVSANCCVGTAPIYIRITEGREAALKMATGHGVLLCEWGRRLQMQLLHYE